MVQKRVATLGPLKQKEFLKNMGIDVRLQVRSNFVINLFINNLLLQELKPTYIGKSFHFIPTATLGGKMG